MRFYREQRKDWKREWKIDKKAKKQSKQKITPFVEWENQRLGELARSNPDKFKEYCEGFKKAQKLKLWVGFGITAAVAICCGAVFIDTALYYGLASASTKAALIPLVGIPVGTYLATAIATRKARAVRFLSKIWHKKDWKLRRIVTHFRKREKGQRRILLKTFDSKSYQTESKGYSAWLKRAKMPKVLQSYLKTNDLEFATNEMMLNSYEAQPQETVAKTKQDIKREWYSDNLLTADKINVSVYGSSKDYRHDYYKKLGSFETDSLIRVFDKDKIGLILGEAGQSVVNSLNDDLLLGVREIGGDETIDTSYTKVGKQYYPLKVEIAAHEDVPEATL